MKRLTHVPMVVGLLAFGVFPSLGIPQATGGETGRATVISREQIEADWIRQDQVRNLPAVGGGVTTREDSAGGCDGVKDGRWGFHTGQENEPWWQVDLGKEMPLDQLLIYNRCDGSTERALQLKVLLSSDGKVWTTAYQHDGSMFRGVTDVRPLSVRLKGAKARLVRIQLTGNQFLHLDEVEVFPTTSNRNVALGKPADQSSVSRWSTRSATVAAVADAFPVDTVIEQGLKLAANQRGLGADVGDHVARLKQIATTWNDLPQDASPEARREIYFQARWTVRKLALANPLLDFDQLLFVKRVPSSFTHMSDQNYGWFSRPGGGLFVLDGLKRESPSLRCLTDQLPAGNILDPDVSYDGTKVLFAHCKFYPGLAEKKDKLDKSKIAEDAFYHLYEINLDGSGLKRLTRGKYDDFSGRYLPSGEIAFLSTRRGQFLQAGRTSAAVTQTGELPDCYVRCGGGSERPVAVYTLQVMDAEGANMRTISPFENFEWTPNVANDGRILYARWDYVDRDNMPYMSLWSTMPDGTAAQAVYGNYTVSPYCTFEARSIPNSHKLVFTASAHHAITGGSLVLLDPSQSADGPGSLTRLTPEVPFPEVEAWPATYYVNPYPLSEHHYLVAWSDQPLAPAWPRVNPPNATGIYLYDALGNLNLIYRDPEISSMHPLPIRPRRRPPAVHEQALRDINQEGRMLLADVYQGLGGVQRGSIRRLRIVGVPAKTQPTMNSPALGITRDDPGKFVLGTVPVEKDGSAFFRVPAGVPIFLQALNKDGKAVQTMRSATYVQPGQTYTCVGCHEPRNTAPANRTALASLREPSRIAPGPEGSWPLDFNVLVQPVLEQHCVRCHRKGADGSQFDLTAGIAYETLISYGGERSLRNHVLTAYRRGRSTAGECAAQSSALLQLLEQGHYDVTLDADARDRLITWMDTYAQRAGSFSPDQQRRLRELRKRLASMLGTSTD
ncbi:MAG: hypothetical protein CMJ50_06190 [Planctomycetaceae bacterium]|nr:hypothetical protein [Planctomycetaceae bacterium]